MSLCNLVLIPKINLNTVYLNVVSLLGLHRGMCATGFDLKIHTVLSCKTQNSQNHLHIYVRYYAIIYSGSAWHKKKNLYIHQRVLPAFIMSELVSHKPSPICVQYLLHISLLSTWAVETNMGWDLRLVVPELVCQSLGEDRWHAEINNPTQHHPFCEQMNLLWQYVYERSGDLLSSHLNILPSPSQAHCYLWQLGPTLLCALMFNSRTHSQAGRRAWVCWELTRAREHRNSDFQQIFPVLLSPVSVSDTAEEFAPCRTWSCGKNMICLWFDCYTAQTDTIKSVWCIKRLVSMRFLEVCLNTTTLRQL